MVLALAPIKLQGALVNLRARATVRPVLYPATILVAFVLNLVVETGVSPYAAGRPLVVAVLVGLGLPWLIGLLTGDRHRAGLIACLFALILLAGQSLLVVAVGVAAIALLVVEEWVSHRRVDASPARHHVWPTVTSVLTAGGVILLVAVGVKAVQLDRVRTIAYDLIAESPLGGRVAADRGASALSLPNMYLVLLDGYPRADKLASEFGIDAAPFVTGLQERGFVVASRSRSNHTATRVTLAQLFDYTSPMSARRVDAGRDDLWRHRINEGEFFDDVRRLGYRVVAVSSGYEHVAVRQADMFIDTGQPNDFEWALLRSTAARAPIEATLPGLVADLSRQRVLDAFEVTRRRAADGQSERQLVFTHIAVPHSPQLFAADGAALDVRGMDLGFDSDEIARYGKAEYVRRLAGQVAFVSTQTLGVVDEIVALDPRAVIVVFSDHGTGVGSDEHLGIDGDLRTANLLAVRSPGRSGIIDDRSTLANVLPRLLRAYAGIGPPDGPEDIYISAEDAGTVTVFRRPD